MHPIILSAGHVVIYSFGLLLALALVVGGVTTMVLAHMARLSTKGLFDTLLFIIFASVVGARLAYVIGYHQLFFGATGNFGQIFALWQGGLVFYGALVGGFIASHLAFGQEKAAFKRWLDILTFGVLLGIVFGQAGCLLGGCASGVDSKMWAFFDHKVPVQLFESMWSLLLFVGGLVLYIKRSEWRRGGLIFFVGGLLYSAGRLVLDYWRPQTLMFKHIPVALGVDLLLIIFLTVNFLRFLHKHKHLTSTGETA